MSAAPPLVSFVVLCYNHEHFIADCLASIFQQRGNHEFEVIVVDDASPDNSAAVIESLTEPRLRFVRHPRNLGHIATVTDGLALARGQFIARIDGDDRYRPDFLSTVLPCFAQHPEVGLVYGDMALMDDQGTITQTCADRTHDGRATHGNEFVALLEENFICAPTVIARRELWEQSLPIPTGLAFHDWYFTLMMARRCDFYFVPQMLADYRIHAQNMHTHIARDKSEEGSIFRLLDQIFSERESSDDLEGQKQRAKARIYGAHYRRLGDKYFWFNLDSDARRCYLAALRYRPRFLLQPGLMRRLAATYVGRGRYEALRDAIKPLLGQSKV